MAYGQGLQGAGKLLNLINRLKRAAPSAARVTSSATRATGAGAKVTGGATKATQAANTATKGAPGWNPIGAAFAPFKAVGQVGSSRPAQTLYAAGGMLGLGTAGTVALENKVNPNSVTSLSNRAKGEVANWDTRTGGLEKNDFGDDLLNLLTGTDRKKLTEATRTERNTQFNELAEVKTALEKLNRGVSGDGFDVGNNVTIGADGRVTLSDTMDSKEQALRIQSEVQRLDKFKALKAEGITGLGGSDSVSSMESKANTYRKNLPTSVESQLARSLERQAYTDEMNRLDRIHRDNVLEYDREYNMGVMNHQAQQAHEDRQQTLQFKLMDRQDARLDRADRVAREDRSDKRATIASMVKGLSQLGYAFAL